MLKKKKLSKTHKFIKKCPTGIVGFDEITFGGLPRNRSTLVCGGAGTGKSMFGIEFLIRGAVVYKEPGLFIAFEETETELAQNIASLGFDVKDLINRRQLVLEHIKIERAEFKEIGYYNLDGLFIRLADIINKFKIKRVVLDTLEILFANLENELILRAELQRLFHWFKKKKITLIATAEQGTNTFTRYGLEEYVTDCVILLDNRLEHQISTRRLRIAKYRGSSHGCNEYPFIINKRGFSIATITAIKLNYKVSHERMSSGIKQLDTMLGGLGFYKGSSILISGPSGIGKSSFAIAFANRTCQRGEKCYYFAFEESVNQIIRNMDSIGFNLGQWINKDLLKFHAINPNSSGLETHLTDIRNLTQEFKPNVVIIDTITNLKPLGPLYEVQVILRILISFFKSMGITTLFTSLSAAQSMRFTKTDEGISSLMDTWINLQYIYGEGERNRGIGILKSRGMNHSNQFREVIISSKGISLLDVYIGTGKVLAGSARLVQATKLEIENLNRESELKHQERKLEIIRKTLEAKINALHSMLEDATEEERHLNNQKEHIYKLVAESRKKIAKLRMSDTTPSPLAKRKEVKHDNVRKIYKKDKKHES